MGEDMRMRPTMPVGLMARVGGVAAVSLLIVAAGPLAAGSSDPGDEPRAITVEARDLATDAPLADVRVEGSGGENAAIRATTDAAGSARFLLPDASRVPFLSVKVAREGYVPLRIVWSRKPGPEAPPDHFRFRMEKATRIGGRVLDQDGRPVAGASVVVSAIKRYPDSEQRAGSDESATTDAEGRWSCAGIPERADFLSVGVYHHSYLPQRPFYDYKDFTPHDALYEGTAVQTLHRGTPITGTVLDPDARPVPGAAVFYGDGGGSGNSIPPIRTDAEGRFTLGIKPGVNSVLTARHEGFGPALEAIHVGDEPQQVTLTLSTPHTLEGRVVDDGGRPVARAVLYIESWRGRASLPQELKADADGRFAWKEAPGDEVKARVWAPDFAERRDVSLLPDSNNQVVLTRTTHIRGTVVDAGTGQPIPRFSVSANVAWNPGERFIWQRGNFMDDESRKLPGAFETVFPMRAHQVLVRVEAEGYLPADAGPFTPDGSDRAFTFRLEKADPIRGAVLNPDGSPAREGAVYLILAGDTLQLRNGRLDGGRDESSIHAKLTADGHFTLPPQKDPCMLMALSDAGFAWVPGRDFRPEVPLRLQPWARVSGTVRAEGRPAAELDLVLQHEGDPVLSDGEPWLVHMYSFKTDSEGRFTAPRVLPGRVSLARRVPNGPAERRVWFVTLAALDARSGQSCELRIGESGRAVTGRFDLPPGVDWLVRKAAITPKAPGGPSPEYGIEVLADGRFRADDLPAGEYSLRAAIHEQPPENACGWGRLVGAFAREFTVAGHAGDPPIDLGTLEPEPAPANERPLRVGDKAPDFAVRTLEGADLTLADFRGKFVLLDFWATWCAPCVAEIPDLRAVHEAFAKDDRFAMVSLSLDEKADDVRYMVKAVEMSWVQGLIGPDSPVATSYDATAIPAIFLIGPDGTILARDLRGAKLKSAIEDALKKP
jgi:peroxiredoxin/protocatechuate 3,4-dioxygenase beta subunit